MSEPLLVFDLETGGLNPHVHGITEIACVVLHHDHWALTDMVEWNTILKPDERCAYTDEALAIQHRVMADLIVGRDTAEAIRELGAWAAYNMELPTFKITPWAHNAPFDMGFLDATCERTGAPFPFNHAYRCSMQLWRTLKDKRRHSVHKSNLDAVCTHYGIEIPEKERHTAIGDCRATAHAICRMMSEL